MLTLVSHFASSGPNCTFMIHRALSSYTNRIWCTPLMTQTFLAIVDPKLSQELVVNQDSII